MAAIARLDTELLVDDVHAVDHEILSILQLVNAALASCDASDPARADLEDIKLAAEAALARMKALESNAFVQPLLRAV